MATKTVTLNGAEQRVDELGGLNALILNNTDAPLYASAKAGVVPYADGVIEIQSGEAQTLPDSNGTVFLLGSGGRAQLTGIVNFKMPSRRSGGGGVTEAEVNGIVTEKIAEVVANAPEDFDTLKEIADWIDGHEDSAAAMNSEIKANAADISDIQTEQETQNSSISSLQEKMEQKADISEVSNPNLLDNPDFRINQRENVVEDTVYTKSGYFFDRWTSHTLLSYEKTNECLEIYADGDLGGGIYLTQHFETNLDADKDHTVSVYTTSGVQSITLKANGERHNLDKCDFTLTQSSANIIIKTGVALPFKGIKLELGGQATPFIPPHPATELLKCQRYFWKIDNLPGNIYKPSIFIAKKMDSAHIRLTPLLNVSTTMRGFPSVKINEIEPSNQISLRCTNDGSIITGTLYVDGFCVYKNGLSCVYLNDFTGDVKDGFSYEASIELSADL